LAGSAGMIAGAGQRTPRTPVGKAQPRACADPALSAAATASSLAAATATDRVRQSYLPNEILIKFRGDADEADQARALTVLRDRPLPSAVEWTPAFARYRDLSGADPVVVADVLSRQPEVEWAQPNYLRTIPVLAPPLARGVTVAAATPAFRVPTDPASVELQWNMALINAQSAWTENGGGDRDIVVAVLDTGVTEAPFQGSRLLWTGGDFERVPLAFEPSPDLAGSRLVAPMDAAFEPGGPVLDFDGHGTHVASTIAEDANNGVGVAGLAYNVRIMPVKVCVGYWELMLRNAVAGQAGFVPLDAGGCADADIAVGIRYAADHGAHVINLSMSGPGPSPVLRDAIRYAVARKVFVAASAGSSYQRGNALQYPARYATETDGFVSVGAVDASSGRAAYSNTSPYLEVVAPGGSSLDIKAGRARAAIWQVSLFPPDADPTLVSAPRFDRFAEVGRVGTSVAVPHVSALAAFLTSRWPNRPDLVEAAIKAMAIDLGPPGRDDEYGNGLVAWRMLQPQRGSTSR
jgi:serine protease